MNYFDLLRISSAIFGVVMTLFAGYLFLSGWSHVNIRTRAYTYITEKDRDKRSIKTGPSIVLLVFGILLISGAIYIKEMTFQDILSILVVGTCLSPLLVLISIFRMRRDLHTYTKTEDDVVFLDKNKNT